MFAILFEARSTCQQRVVLMVAEGNNLQHRGAAFGKGTGFIDCERIDFFQPLEDFGIFNQHTFPCATPDADHDRHRRRESQGTGTGNDQYSHRVDNCPGRFGWLCQNPDQKGESCAEEYGGNKNGRDPVGNLLDRRSAPLGIRNAMNNLCQQSVAPDPTGHHQKSARLIQCPTDQRIARDFIDRDRFAGEHRFIDRTSSLGHFAVDRNFFTRADA